MKNEYGRHNRCRPAGEDCLECRVSVSSIGFEYGNQGPDGGAVVALTAVILVRARSLPMDEWAVL